MKFPVFLSLILCSLSGMALVKGQSFVQNQISNCSYLGDINGDSVDDLITINDKQITVSKTDVNQTPILTHTFGATVKRIIIGDFVNSGRERGKKQIAAILSDGTTQAFAISDDLRSLWWWFTQNSFIADNEFFTTANFDNDVAEEIMIHNPTNGQIRFFKRGTNGLFSQMNNFEIGNLGGTSPAGTSLANVQVLVGAFSSDHPGRKDLLIVDHASGQLRLYGSVLLPNGNLTFWWAFTTNGNLFPANSQLCVANIDGGARDGLIIRNGMTNAYSLHKVEFSNGSLAVETGAITGQLAVRTGNCRLVAAKVRDANFRTERGGAKRDDILILEAANNQLTRTDARFDGTNLTYWWAFAAPLNCGRTTNNWDFEAGDLRGWTATGVFSNQPTFEENFTVQQLRNSLPNLTTALRTVDNIGGDYWRDAIYPIGIQGKYWVGSGENRRTQNNPAGGKQTGIGTLVSSKFTLQKKYISFLMGKSSLDTLNLKVEILGRDQNGSITIENERYRVLSNGMGAWLDFTAIEQINKKLPPELRIRVPVGGKTYLKGPAENVINPYLDRVVYDVSKFIGQEVRIRIVDNDVNGFINVDDFQFVDVQVNENRQPPLWGMADLHTHPMSEVSFGGDIFAGKIDGTPQAALFKCSEREHGGFDLFKPTDETRRQITDKMEEGVAYKAYQRSYTPPCDHWFGYESGNNRSLCFWPSFKEVTHQEMYKDWLKRARDGGLRVIVALAHHNQVLCEIGHGNQTERRSCDDDASLVAQINHIRNFVRNNNTWIEIAETPAQLRQIVRRGNLAVVVGSEMDNFGNFYKPKNFNNQPDNIYIPNPTPQQIRDRIVQLKRMGVNYIFPVHLVDNIVGGAAIYSDGFEPAQRFYNNGSDFTLTQATASDSIFFGRPGLPSFGLAGGGFDLFGWFASVLEGAVSDLTLTTRGVDISINDNTPLKTARMSLGIKNAKGLNTNNNIGEMAIKEMMRQGMMIDIDHMSQSTADAVIDLAKISDYPLNSGHTGFRGMGHGSEDGRTSSQINYIRNSGGMQGIAWGCGDAKDFSSFFPTQRFTSSRVDNNGPGSAKTFSQTYLYALEKYQGKQIAFGSDINSLVVEPGPRFGPDACWCISPARKSMENTFKSAQNNPVRYNGGVDVAGSFFFGTTGNNPPMSICETLGKRWSINTDGIAHYGLLPDFVQDMKNVGVNPRDLTPLFMSAEYFAQMWEKCERQKTNIR